MAQDRYLDAEKHRKEPLEDPAGVVGKTDPVDPELERLRRHVSGLEAANAALRRENDEWRRVGENNLKPIVDAIPAEVGVWGPTGDPLRESELQSRLIVSTIPGLVVVSAPDGAIEGANEQFLEYLGQTFEQARDWRTNGTTHPEDLPAAVEIFSRSLASGEPFEFEARLRRFDGVYRWLQIRGNPSRDSDGRIIRWYGLLTDIDDRKRAEEALRASEVGLRKIINTLPTTAWSTRADGYCDFLSHRWLDYAGLTAEEAEGWNWGSVLHPDDAPALFAYWQGCLATGTPVDKEARMRRFDGVYRWFLFRANPLRDENGTIIKWYGTNIDIEDRRRGDALRESELQSRLIVSTIPGLVALFAPDGTIDGANEQFLEYLGQTFEQARNWATNGTTHPDDLRTSSEVFARSLASGHPFAFEARLRRFDGVYRWFQIRGNPAWDSDGRIARWYGLLIDIEDRRRAEDALSALRSELAHMSRISSLGVLTASVAHEVNQPLAGIITNASTCVRLLSASPPQVEGALETARRTIRDGNRAAEVVGRLRTLFSKETAKNNEEVDLNEAAAEVIALTAGDLHRNRVIVRTDFAEALPRLTADRVQLQQVIMNLLLNASGAMSDVSDRPRLAVMRTTRDGGDVRLSVEDAGAGFAPEDTERLFQAFYTTKSSGMGIGLSVSRSIIESHNGRLWGEPNDGPGATFTFSVPASARGIFDD